MRLIIIVVLANISVFVHAQCVNATFTVANEDKLCRDSPVEVLHDGNSDISYYWDFCPEDFSESPGNYATSISGFSNAYGYKLIEDNGLWYGFLVSRSGDNLIRLDFGNDPLSSPTFTDLGNPGNLMDAPEGIDLFKDGDNWVAFVGKGENSTGQVVKFDFGNDLQNMPTATGYGTFGLGSIRIRDLAIIRQGNDIIVLLLIYNTSAINRVNFGNSLSNGPSANNIVSIPATTLPRGFNVVTNCSPWRVHIASESGLLQQVTFNNDILGPLSVEGAFSFTSVAQPWKVKSVFTQGKYYCIISNNGRKYSIIDFGDLSLTVQPVQVANTNDIRFIGFDVIKYKGKSILQGGGGTNIFNSVSYAKSCNVDIDYSYEENPGAFRFRDASAFHVDLTGYQNHRVISEFSRSLIIRDLDAPVIDISYQGLCQGQTVYFQSIHSDPVLSYLWDFGNGVTSTSATPETSYGSAGVYSISLHVEATNSCYTSKRIAIRSYNPPVSEFSISPTLLCTNNAFLFPTTTPDIYDGNLSYEWYVDNNLVGTERDLEYTFTTTGPKELRLKTSIPGCSDEITKTTSSVQPGPVVDFSFTGTCEDETFSFLNKTSETVESFSWDFGNGQTSTDTNPSALFADAGDFSVTLTATTTIGCENSSTKTLNVHSKPLVDFSADGPPNACSGITTLFANTTTNPDGAPITEWLWDYGDGTVPVSQAGSHGQHIFDNGGAFAVSLTAISEYGCAGMREKVIDILPSPSTDFSFTPACDDIPVQFKGPADSDITSLYWEIGTSYYDGAEPTHTFRSPGDYPLYLEVAGSNGCIATRTRTIHVPDPLTPNFSVIKNCVDHEAVFTDVTTGADPVSAREWRFDGQSFSSSPLTHTFSTSGNRDITLRVTAASGCMYEVTKTVAVVQRPVAAFTAAPALGASPLSVNFLNTSTGATQYLWELSDGTGATSDDASPVYVFTDAGTFPVRLTAMNDQQCESTAVLNVSVASPLPDADISLLTLSTNPDGSLKLIATIHNKGNTVIRDMPMDIDLSGKLSMRHTVEGPIQPGAMYNAILGPGILDPGDLRYICVRIDLENDLNPAMNVACQELDGELVVLPAYPNPASAMLNIEWISDVQEPMSISVCDALGRRVFSTRVMSGEGLNRQQLDLSTAGNGVYMLLIEGSDTRMVQRILISDNP